MTTLSTSIGEAAVSHRLALAVECIDAATERVVTAPVDITREFDPPRLPSAQGVGTGFVTHGPGRAMMVHGRRSPTIVTVQITDATRQFVPRRLTIPLWSLAEVSDDNRFVPAELRRLQPWLLPGSGYPLVRGVTALRGRVETNGAVVRWPRVAAQELNKNPVGWAHGDERGEFVLVLDIPYVLPTRPDVIPINLFVSAPATNAVPTSDPLDDLVIEHAARLEATPPSPAEQSLLRGRTTPPGYRTAPAPVPVTARLATFITLDNPVPFPL